MASRENDFYPQRENDFVPGAKMIAQIDEALSRVSLGAGSSRDTTLLGLVVDNKKLITKLPPSLRRKLEDARIKRKFTENDRLSTNANDPRKMVPSVGGLGGSFRPVKSPQRDQQLVTAANLVSEAERGVFSRKSAVAVKAVHANEYHWKTDETGAQSRSYVDNQGRTVEQTRTAEQAVLSEGQVPMSRAAALIFMEEGVTGRDRRELVNETYARAVDLVDRRHVDLDKRAKRGDTDLERAKNRVTVEMVRVLRADLDEASAGRDVGSTVDLSGLQEAFSVAAKAMVAEQRASAETPEARAAVEEKIAEMKGRYDEYFANARKSRSKSAADALAATEEQPGYAPVAGQLRVTTTTLELGLVPRRYATLSL